jgi:putative chitinase
MLLKVGSEGSQVKLLQEKLGIVSDGEFGNGTERAVKQWQSANGLKPDGIVGSGTWSKMFPPSRENLQLDRIKHMLTPEVYSQLPLAIEKFNIINKLRLAHFLAQCAHESGSFKLVKENLNYSEQSLKSIFGKYFRDVPASDYARNPEKIASRVYGGRMGNGSESTKDGWKFRGRGYIQLTGKNNYVEFSKFIGEDCVNNPDLVSDKYPLASAAFFFDSNNLWRYCDLGSDEDTIKKVTKAVNGGYHGLDDRRSKFNKIWSALS